MKYQSLSESYYVLEDVAKTCLEDIESLDRDVIAHAVMSRLDLIHSITRMQGMLTIP